MSDLIRRQAAIDECDKQYPNIDRQDFKAVINAVPSADRPTVDKEYLIDLIQEAVYDGEACAKLIDLVDRPTGEWVEVDSFESEKHSVTDMRCSLCGKYASMVLPHRTRCVYDFCPNCGAKMGGDD